MGTGDQRATALASYVAQFRSLKFSRDDELEADLWGLQLMPKIGYDPREMIDLQVAQLAQSLGRSRYAPAAAVLARFIPKQWNIGAGSRTQRR